MWKDAFQSNQVMHTILVVAFPFILVGFEAGFRFLAEQPVWDFVGPSLSVAGLSFLVSATKFEKYKVDTAKSSSPTATVDNGQYVSGVYLCILIGILIWGVSLYLSIIGSGSSIFLMPNHAWVGTFIYISSVVIFHARKTS